jgi:hypothetical protein
MKRYSLPTGLAGLAVVGCLAQPAVAQDLPRPYVSRALDSVLLPVDTAVIAAFGLSPNDSGVLVLATEPGGTADMAGFLPGDVIANVRGTRVKDPVQLDSVVWYWIQSGVDDFGWEISRGGEYTFYEWVITEEEFWTEIDISAAASWTSWEYESWSYSAYYEEYSEVMIEEYSSSERVIEETVSSEEFVSEVETSYEESYSEESHSEAEVSEESSSEESASEESTSEETMTGESVGEETEDGESSSADEAAGEEMADEEAMAEDDGSMDDGSMDDGSEDDGSADESAEDDTHDEGADDGSADDGGGDDGGDDGGGEDVSAEE